MLQIQNVLPVSVKDGNCLGEGGKEISSSIRLKGCTVPSIDGPALAMNVMGINTALIWWWLKVAASPVCVWGCLDLMYEAFFHKKLICIRKIKNDTAKYCGGLFCVCLHCGWLLNASMLPPCVQTNVTSQQNLHQVRSSYAIVELTCACVSVYLNFMFL